MLYPVPALTIKAIGNHAVNSYTDTQCYWVVVCEMAVQCAYPTHRPLATAANCKLSEHVMYSNYTKPNTSLCTIYGQYVSKISSN